MAVTFQIFLNIGVLLSLVEGASWTDTAWKSTNAVGGVADAFKEFRKIKELNEAGQLVSVATKPLSEFNKAFRGLSKIAGALGPMFALVGVFLSFLDDQDAQHKELLREFQKVHKGIDEVRKDIGALKDYVTCQSAINEISKYVDKIEYAFSTNMDLINAPDDQTRAVYKERMKRSYSEGKLDEAIHGIYSHFTSTEDGRTNVIEARYACTKGRLQDIIALKLWVVGLLLEGNTVLVAAHTLYEMEENNQYENEAVRIAQTTNEFDSEETDLLKKFDEVLQKCKDHARQNMEDDLITDGKLSSRWEGTYNHDTANNIFGFLAKKYFWLSILVVVYDDENGELESSIRLKHYPGIFVSINSFPSKDRLALHIREKDSSESKWKNYVVFYKELRSQKILTTKEKYIVCAFCQNLQASLAGEIPTKPDIINKYHKIDKNLKQSNSDRSVRRQIALMNPQNKFVALRSNINKNVKYVQKEDYYEINFLDVTDLQVDSEDEIDDEESYYKIFTELQQETIEPHRKVDYFLIGGGGSSYQEGGGGSGFINSGTFYTGENKEKVSISVGAGGCNRDNNWNSEDEDGTHSALAWGSMSIWGFGNIIIAKGGKRGGIISDEGGDGWSGGGGDDGGSGGENGENGQKGQYGDRGGYGTGDQLPNMKMVKLSPGKGGRGGAEYGKEYEYDGGGGGGVIVDGKGPAIRKDHYNHESGEGYGAGGSYGYEGGEQECGTSGLVLLEVHKIKRKKESCSIDIKEGNNFIMLTKGTGQILVKGNIGTKMTVFMIGGGGSSYQEGGGGSGFIKTFEYNLKVERTFFTFSVGIGGCNKDNNWNSIDEDGTSSTVTFSDNMSNGLLGFNSLLEYAAGGKRGGIVSDEGGDGWSGGGGDDGGVGGHNGGNGGKGQYGDQGGHGSYDKLPKMKWVELSAGKGGRGGEGYGNSYKYDGGGGGGVWVDSKGPQIRKDKYNHESGQGYGSGGSYGYNGGAPECGTPGLIIVEINKC